MSTSQNSQRRVFSLAAALVVAGTAVTACSSGGSGSGTPAASSAKVTFTGAPISIGIITDVGTVVNDTDGLAAAKAAIRAVNGRGGIAGHQVKLDFCNESLDPNKARACGRQMVSDHVIATAGNTVITAEGDDNKLLSDAGIASVGATSYSGLSGTDANNYLFSPGFDYSNTAMTKVAVDAGAKRIAQLVLDSPSTANYEPVVSAVAKGLGAQYVGTVTVPQVTADLSTQAAALVNDKPDTVILNASGAASLEIMKDMAGLGYTGRFVSAGQQFKQSDLEALGGLPNELLLATPFPPVSETGIKGVAAFVSDMKAEKAAGDNDAPTDSKIVRTNATSAWLAILAIERIADQAKATTAADFKKAIDAATDVDLDGMIPAWTPNKTTTGPVTRASNGAFFAVSWTNGDVKLLSKTAIDVTDLVNTYDKG